MDRGGGLAKRVLIVIAVATVGAMAGYGSYWRFHDRIPIEPTAVVAPGHPKVLRAASTTIEPPITFEQILAIFQWMAAGALISGGAAFVIGGKLRHPRLSPGGDS